MILLIHWITAQSHQSISINRIFVARSDLEDLTFYRPLSHNADRNHQAKGEDGNAYHTK